MTASQRREAVLRLKGLQVSERRSCQIVGISRPGFRYQSRRSDDELIEKLNAMASEHPRYGYRRACALLRRSGARVNHKRVHRVWKQSQLCLPLRRPRKKRAGSSTLGCSRALFPNHVWTYDFVFDRCANGQKVKLLTLVDEYTRESLAIRAATSITSGAVIETLSRLVAERGVPLCLRSDNTGRSSSLSESKSGSKRRGSRRSILNPAVRGRMPWEKASTGDCGMSV